MLILAKVIYNQIFYVEKQILKLNNKLINHQVSFPDPKTLEGYYQGNIRTMDMKAFSLGHTMKIEGLYYIIIYDSRKHKKQYLNLPGLFLLA